MLQGIHPQRTGENGEFHKFFRRLFIAEADRLRGKFEICTIKSRKDSGQTINLVVTCASSIMLSNVQFF